MVVDRGGFRCGYGTAPWITVSYVVIEEQEKEKVAHYGQPHSGWGELEGSEYKRFILAQGTPFF
jgi:hypothetical protein